MGPADGAERALGRPQPPGPAPARAPVPASVPSPAPAPASVPSPVRASAVAPLPPTPGRLSRRRLMGAAAVGVGGAVLSACATRAGGAGPSPSSPPVVLTFQPNGTLAFNRTTVTLYQDALQPFYAKHPAVRVNIVPTQWHGNVQAILGGTGADVISDNYPPLYMASGGNLLLKLDGYIKRDNLDVSQWSPGQIASYTGAAPDHGLYMLPGYFSPFIYVVRLADFDAAGVARPDPAWSYQDFALAAKRMTTTIGKQKRFGAVVEWFTDHIGEATWPFFGFGAGMLDKYGHSALSTDSNLAAGKFLYEELFWPGVATTRDQLGPWYGTPEFVRDLTTMQLSWNGLVLDNAQRFQGFDWDYYPPPVFPQGPTCMATDDFYGIAATTKNAEMAWALLTFLAADATAKGWQRSVMKIGLLQPCLNALWDEWIATVAAVAPPLKQKNLHHFKDLAVSGRAFPEQYYPRVDQQCQNVAVPIMRDLWAHKMDVPTAFSQIDLVVNALLAQAEVAEAAQTKMAAAIAAVTPGPGVTYPAPAPDGLGASSTPAERYIVSDQVTGTWTLLGDGTDTYSASDNTTFACLAVTEAQGQWTARVTALANLTCPALSPWAKLGLMIRGDLSDDAPMAALHITGGNGIEWQYRAVPGVTPGGVSNLALKGASGQSAKLTAPLDKLVANYLQSPLWLQLRRLGTTWSAFASTDGKFWTQVGSSQVIRAGGVYLGIHCCAHNSDFNAKGYIRGAFDHLTFTPTQRLQVGDQGVPPGAGPVAANWATVRTGATPAVPPVASSAAAK